MRFAPAARAELRAAAEAYEEARSGLGLAFLAETRRVIARVEDYPESGAVVPGADRRLRRVLLRAFPFAVVYRAVGSETRVVAIAHVRRRPGYWRSD